MDILSMLAEDSPALKEQIQQTPHVYPDFTFHPDLLPPTKAARENNNTMTATNTAGLIRTKNKAQKNVDDYAKLNIFVMQSWLSQTLLYTEKFYFFLCRDKPFKERFKEKYGKLNTSLTTEDCAALKIHPRQAPNLCFSTLNLKTFSSKIECICKNITMLINTLSWGSVLQSKVNNLHKVLRKCEIRCDVQLLVEGVCLFPYILKPGFRCKTFGDEDEVNLITANLMAQSQHTKSALGSSLPRSCVCCNILMKKSEAVRFEKLKDEDRALLEEERKLKSNLTFYGKKSSSKSSVTDHAASSGCGGGEDEAEEESESSPKLKRRSAKSKVIITHTDPPRKIFGQKRKERKILKVGGEGMDDELGEFSSEEEAEHQTMSKQQRLDADNERKKGKLEKKRGKNVLRNRQMIKDLMGHFEIVPPPVDSEEMIPRKGHKQRNKKSGPKPIYATPTPRKRRKKVIDPTKRKMCGESSSNEEEEVVDFVEAKNDNDSEFADDFPMEVNVVNRVVKLVCDNSPISVVDPWPIVMDKFVAVGFEYEEVKIDGGLKKSCWVFPGGKHCSKGGVLNVDFLESHDEFKRFARRYFDWGQADLVEQEREREEAQRKMKRLRGKTPENFVEPANLSGLADSTFEESFEDGKKSTINPLKVLPSFVHHPLFNAHLCAPCGVNYQKKWTEFEEKKLSRKKIQKEDEICVACSNHTASVDIADENLHHSAAVNSKCRGNKCDFSYCRKCILFMGGGHELLCAQQPGWVCFICRFLNKAATSVAATTASQYFMRTREGHVQQLLSNFVNRHITSTNNAHKLIGDFCKTKVLDDAFYADASEQNEDDQGLSKKSRKNGSNIGGGDFLGSMYAHKIKDVETQNYHIKVVNEANERVAMSLEEMNFFDSSGVSVLSLFSGIEVALASVKQLGIKVQRWVTVECDQDAVEVIKSQHNDLIADGRLEILPDVMKITSQMVSEWGAFNLMIGGSPCQDFSFQGNLNGGDRAGLDGGRGKLAFQFFRILRLVERENARRRRIPPVFVFENVNGMSTEVKMEIVDWLETQPCCFQAELLSPAARPRDFYTNLKLNPLPEAAYAPNLQQILVSPAEALREKAKCILTSNGVEVFKTNRDNSFYDDEKRWIEPFNRVYRSKHDHSLGFRNLSLNECERVFGLHDGYCSILGDSKSNDIQRQWRLLGNAFSLPVIVSLLSPLQKNFPSCKYDRYPIEIRILGGKEEGEEPTGLVVEKLEKARETKKRKEKENDKEMEIDLWDNEDVLLKTKAKAPTKMAKDPNAPMRAYLFYSAEMRPVIKEANPELNFAEITKKMGANWKTLEEKRKYHELAKADKVRFVTETAEYEKTKGEAMAMSDSDDSEEKKETEKEKLPESETGNGSESDEQDEEEEKEEELLWKPGLDSIQVNWIQCDGCEKWRIIPSNIDEFEKGFVCKKNRWARHKSEKICK